MVLFYYLDFPLPHGDDLFFAGTAAHYAQTGNFINPGVIDYTSQFSEIQKPYWFVPLHMRLLGWWLSITNISDISIRIYVLFCIMITTIFTNKWCRTSQLHSKFSTYLVPIIIIFGFRWSLRPECTAIPLFTIGLFYLFQNDNSKNIWLGTSFLGLSSLSSQILVIPTVFIAINSLFQKQKEVSLCHKAKIMGICVLQTISVGALMINFEISIFIEMFTDHIIARKSTIIENLNFFYFMICELGNGYLLRLPSLLLLVACVVILVKAKLSNKHRFTCLLLSLLVMICLYAKSFEIILYLLTFISLIIIIETKKFIKSFFIITILLLCLRSGTHLLAYSLFCDRTKDIQDTEISDAFTYIIDEYTIRHPLNWQFPKKWKIAPDFYTNNDRLLNKPPSEKWIVSMKNLAYFYPTLYTQEKIRIGGKQFSNLPVKYWEYKILP